MILNLSWLAYGLSGLYFCCAIVIPIILYREWKKCRPNNINAISKGKLDDTSQRSLT